MKRKRDFILLKSPFFYKKSPDKSTCPLKISNHSYSIVIVFLTKETVVKRDTIVYHMVVDVRIIYNTPSLAAVDERRGLDGCYSKKCRLFKLGGSN